jgi:hypothetical protein
MEMQKPLIDRVITQIELDMRGDDLTALEELLKSVPEQVLESYLPEVDFENLDIEIDDISHLNENIFINENDGQPDEAQEWHDFDPDC